MSIRGHSASVGAAFLSLFTCFFLFALTQCTTPEAGQRAEELGMAVTYTSVPFTPDAAGEIGNALTVPATFTPDGSAVEVGLSSGQGDGNRGEATATTDLTGHSTVIEVRRTGSPTNEPGLIPSTVPTVPAGNGATPTNPPPPTNGAPTPTNVPGQIGATPTIKVELTDTPGPATITPFPSATPNLNVNPKKGIGAAYAWAYADGHQPFSPGWYYTWSLFPGLWEANGPDFVPMWPCHGTVDYVVGSLGADYDGYLLFLNEPDREEQCHQTIDEAVDYYLMVRNALPLAKLVGPQTIGSSDYNWAAWTGNWRERVRERTGSYPDVVGYGFHVYPFFNSGIPTQQVMQSWCDSIASWGELGSKEIWVTEFGVHNFDGTPAEVQAELTDMVNLFENGLGDCEIARYAYFTDRRVGIEGNPTPTIAPGGPNYFDLYWRNSYELSYTGQVYANIANPGVVSAEPTKKVEPTELAAAPSPIPIRTMTPSVSPTPSATPSVSPSPSATPAPMNPKKGIAATYAWAYESGYEPFGAGWYYTWSLFPGEWANSGMDFIPMWPCHGSVEYVVGSLGADYDGYLLFLNEPDLIEQCHVTIDVAVQYYLTIRESLPHAKLIGPQTITALDGDFAGWTRAWRERVNEVTGSYPDVAGYGIHIYPLFNGDIDTLEVLTDWCTALNDWGEVGQSELWITEFGVHNFDGTPSEVATEVAYMVNLFESGVNNCEFDRYAYFTDRRAPVTENPVPTIQPGGSNYFDLYWRNSWELSYTGQAYAAQSAEQ